MNRSYLIGLELASNWPRIGLKLDLYLAQSAAAPGTQKRLQIYNHVRVLSRSIQGFFQNQVREKISKGQLISKCLLGVVVSTKKPTKFF